MIIVRKTIEADLVQWVLCLLAILAGFGSALLAVNMRPTGPFSHQGSISELAVAPPLSAPAMPPPPHNATAVVDANDATRTQLINIFSQLLLAAIGEVDIDQFNSAELPGTALVLLLLYMLFVFVVLFNLLIALMGATYTRMQEQAKMCGCSLPALCTTSYCACRACGACGAACACPPHASFPTGLSVPPLSTSSARRRWYWSFAVLILNQERTWLGEMMRSRQ